MFDRKKFFDAIRNSDHVFTITNDPRAVDGTDSLITAWEASGLTDKRWFAYDLATAYRETAATMRPIGEYGHGAGRAYGHPTGPWHVVYYGRGDVQLTWEANYKHATIELRKRGVIGPDDDLEKNPELALRPDIAAAIMIWGMAEGWFTGHKLADYFNDKDPDGDPDAARHIINGTDHAALIASYHWDFMDAINAGTAASGAST